MSSIVNPTCPNCGGYLYPPFSWSSTVPPTMCTCAAIKQNNVGWICPRCGKSNSPNVPSCGCSANDPLKVTC